MFWKKKKVEPYKYAPLIGSERFQVGDLFKYNEPGKSMRYVYITDNQYPTLEGTGYKYMFTDEDIFVLNQDAKSEPRHLEDFMTDGFLFKIKDFDIIAKFVLLMA